MPGPLSYATAGIGHNQGPDLADDLLEGAAGIARFLYGEANPTTIRSVYRLVTEVEPEFRLPVFRLGRNSLAARKSTILSWVAAQEARQMEAAG